LELGRRRQSSDALERQKFNSSKDVGQFLIGMMQDFEKEKFCVLYLNHANKLITHEIVSEGSLTATVVDTKLILRNALHHLASKIIVAHNHPSGNLTPSSSDIQLTQKIKDAATIMEIELLDHIIVAGNAYLSFKDEAFL